MSKAFLERCGYRHDVFVSYSQGDIEGSGNSLLDDWSQGFANLLREFLTGILKEQVSIFLRNRGQRNRGQNRMALT